MINRSSRFFPVLAKSAFVWLAATVLLASSGTVGCDGLVSSDAYKQNFLKEYLSAPVVFYSDWDEADQKVDLSSSQSAELISWSSATPECDGCVTLYQGRNLCVGLRKIIAGSSPRKKLDSQSRGIGSNEDVQGSIWTGILVVTYEKPLPINLWVEPKSLDLLLRASQEMRTSWDDQTKQRGQIVEQAVAIANQYQDKMTDLTGWDVDPIKLNVGFENSRIDVAPEMISLKASDGLYYVVVISNQTGLSLEAKLYDFNRSFLAPAIVVPPYGRGLLAIPSDFIPLMKNLQYDIRISSLESPELPKFVLLNVLDGDKLNEIF